MNRNHRRRAVLLASITALFWSVPALAESAIERERLALVVRQIDQITRQLAEAEQSAPPDNTRYRFDYHRIRDDLNRMRAGLDGYLNPKRAQPRDMMPFADTYTHEDGRASP
jgi:RAQPRD family integrative conjugative element protein